MIRRMRPAVALVLLALTAGCSQGSSAQHAETPDSPSPPTTQRTSSASTSGRPPVTVDTRVAPMPCELLTSEQRKALGGVDLPFLLGNGGNEPGASTCVYRRDPVAHDPTVTVDVAVGAQAAAKMRQTLTRMTNDPDLTSEERKALRLLGVEAGRFGACELHQRMVAAYQGQPGRVLRYTGRSSTDPTRLACTSGDIIEVKVSGAEPERGAFDQATIDAAERFRTDVLPKLHAR